MKKKTNIIKGKIEFEFNGVKYLGTIEAQPEIQKETRDYRSWGIRIDRHNADPEKSVEYIGDAAGYTPARGSGAGSWADNPVFNKIKPCLMKNGEVVKYLNPDNYTEFEDRSRASMRDYFDTMVEFGKVFYRISQDDKYTYVEVTDDEKALKDGYTDWAFSYKGKVRDKFYVGAYLGVVDNKGALRSIPGHTPTGSLTIGKFRESARKNGKGYEILPFNKLVLLQALYAIRFKSLDCQTALGKGLTSANDYGKTGETDAVGLYDGNDDARYRVKCHGLEDFWGNKLAWIDGFITNDKIWVADGNFNDNGEGYEAVTDLPEDVYGVLTDIYGENKLGFVPKAADNNRECGSGYFCNYTSTWTDDAAYLPYFGGTCSFGASAGAFFFCCVNWASYSVAGIGARLTFCGDEE